MSDLAEYVDSVLHRDFSPDQRAIIARLLSDFLSDAIQPTETEYRRAAKRCLHVLIVIDEIMSGSRRPRRAWQQVAIALGLPSASTLTETAVARANGRTQPAVSYQVRKFLRLAELQPAFNRNGSGLAKKML